MMHLENLGSDVLGIVLEYLQADEVRGIRAVSKYMVQLGSDETFWRRKCVEGWRFTETDARLLLSGRLKDYGKNRVDFLHVYPFIYPFPREYDGRISKHLDGVVLTRNENHNCGALSKLEFRGHVEEGNRSIRTDRPFPWMNPESRSSSKGRCTHWFGRLCRPVLSYSPEVRCSRNGFAYPVTKKDRYGQIVVDISPKRVAYFEITIQVGSRASPPPARDRSLYESDCIAVGLSTDAFDLSSKMPGWDKNSYGYHGDDGGIFHGTGTKLQKYGPTFGHGDTVGCGLDYREGEGIIFFTLNGRYLGDAFKGVQGSYYPTVGIDSNAQVTINFGSRPFQFDFSSVDRPLLSKKRDLSSLCETLSPPLETDMVMEIA